MSHAEQIHASHDLESIDDVGHCKVCLEAWIGEVMTPGLAAPCTKVKPERDPMTTLINATDWNVSGEVAKD